jgi:hypothetical protein
MEDQDPYAGEDPESFNQWFPIEHDFLNTSPFKFYWCKLKSGSPEIVELVMDPISTLRGKEELAIGPLPGVEPDSLVTTTLFGHEKSLRYKAIWAVAAVDEEERTVSISSHKQTG